MKIKLKGVIFFIVMTMCLGFNHLQALALDDSWQQFKEQFNIPVDKSWVITFNKEIKNNDIDGIIVGKDNIYIPTKIELLSDKKVKITPINNYEYNSRYYIKIFLKNGRRAIMYFNTQKYINENFDGLDYLIEEEIIAADTNYGPLWTIDDKNFLSVGGEDYSYTYTRNNYLQVIYDVGDYNSFRGYAALESNYSRLTGKLGIDDSSRDDMVEMRFEIICDGYSKFDKVMKKGDKAIDVDIDLTNCNKLIFKVTKTKASSDIYSDDRIDFMNVKFYKSN